MSERDPTTTPEQSAQTACKSFKSSERSIWLYVLIQRGIVAVGGEEEVWSRKRPHIVQYLNKKH